LSRVERGIADQVRLVAAGALAGRIEKPCHWGLRLVTPDLEATSNMAGWRSLAALRIVKHQWGWAGESLIDFGSHARRFVICGCLNATRLQRSI